MWNLSQKAEDQIEELFNITSAMCIGGVWAALPADRRLAPLPLSAQWKSGAQLWCCFQNTQITLWYFPQFRAFTMQQEQKSFLNVRTHILFFFFFSILWVIIFVLTKPEQAEQLWISPKLSESRHNPHTKLLCAKTQHEETGMAESSWGTLLGTEKPAGGVRRLLCISRAAWCPPSELLAASRAHRIEVVGRDLWRSLSPTPC